jgi:hypothetical protein
MANSREERDARARASKQQQHDHHQPGEAPPHHAPPPQFDHDLIHPPNPNPNLAPELQLSRCTRCRKNQPIDLFFLPDGTERRTCAVCRARDAKARAMKHQSDDLNSTNPAAAAVAAIAAAAAFQDDPNHHQMLS